MPDSHWSASDQIVPRLRAGYIVSYRRSAKTHNVCGDDLGGFASLLAARIGPGGGRYVERIFYCDWRDCEAHTRTASTVAGMSFLTITGDAGRTLHFCWWDCVLKHAAEIPPVEVVAVSDG